MNIDTVDPSTRVPAQFWRPSGYGTVRLDAGRSWSLTGDYTRSITVLQGIAPDVFVSHTGSIGVSGSLRPWLETGFTAGYSNGSTGQSPSGGAPGSYDGYTGKVQLRVRLTRWWSSVVSVNHFQYSLNAAASQALGLSHQMSRNSAQVGFTWLLPLYGWSSQRAES